MSDFLVKIEKQENGSYTWSCPIEADYYRKSMGAGLKACIGIAVFLLLYGAFLSFQFRDWQSFLIVAGCAAVFLLITFVIFGLAFSAKNPQESYALWEDHVKIGVGKSSVFFNYSKARTAVFTQKYIELKGKMKKVRVYAPEEDFAFVQSFIMNRLPGSCDIRFE